MRRGFDTMLGLAVVTLGSLDHNDTALPRRPHVGGNIGFAFDVRLDWLVIDFGVQYRMLLPIRGAGDTSPIGPEHVLTLTIGVGVGGVS